MLSPRNGLRQKRFRCSGSPLFSIDWALSWRCLNPDWSRGSLLRLRSAQLYSDRVQEFLVMRILVVGGGSTGGYFGGRLSRAGRDVSFLLRPARAEFLRKNGLVIRTAQGDITLQPNIITAGERAAPFDLVLLSVKSWSLPGAMDDFAPYLAQESMILPFLNGMRHMDTLRDHFGANSVLGGVCRVSSTLDADGAIRQLSPVHQLEYGELNGEVSPRLQQLH